MDATVALGILVAFLAGAAYDIGYGLQALDAREVEHEHALRPSLIGQLAKRRRWVLALCLTLLGWPLQIWAFSLAPVTVVQPTLALGLVTLLFLGAKVLGERVGPREIGATILIIGGVVLVTIAAPAKGEVDAVGPGLWIALGILALIAALPYALGAQRWKGSMILILSAGAADGAAAFLGKVISDDIASGLWLAALLWTALTIGAVLMGFLSELTALQRSPATRVAPIVLVCQIVIPVILAPILAGENWGDTPGGGILIVLGLALVLGGAAVLAATRAVSGLMTGEAEPEDARGQSAEVDEAEVAAAEAP